MFLETRCVFLAIGAEHKMRLDMERPLRVTAVAVVAVGRFVAAFTGLRVVQGLDRVDHDKVGAVASRNIIPLVIPGTQVRIDPATGMAVEAEGLLVALGAVAPGIVGHGTMSPDPVCIMVR
jgi:hypothetical protein